ncbi:unnamed protein product [Mytilus coruscus]|uniref:BEN domain-containing protein n=1 Tax=Mytilus coruscus TaxID=42192 RepID=A0A6J8DJN2_MYTCO|nr:unnamed protein product [Mytilus coruscus]
MQAQNKFAVMLWQTDHGKMSVHSLGKIKEPLKPWNDFKLGYKGKASYPGYKELWDFEILAIGECRKSMENKLTELIENKQNNAGTGLDNTNRIDRPALAEIVPGHTPNRKRKQATNVGIPSADKHDSDDEADDGSSPAVTREAIKTAKVQLPEENQSHVPHPQTSRQNQSHQTVHQPISIHKELHLPVTPQLSQQNESRVPVTQLSQQNKWHDIPVHQQLSQQNPLQIPLLHQLSPQQSQSHVQVPKQLFQQNQSLGPQQQSYPYYSNMYNQNQSSTSNGQNSFQYMSMLMNNNDHQFQQDIQVPPIRQSLETAYNWPISSHTNSFCESGTSFEPLIEQVISDDEKEDTGNPSQCHKCCDQLKYLKKEIKELKKDLEKLKKKSKKNQSSDLKDADQLDIDNNRQENNMVNGYTKDEIERTVKSRSDVTQAVKATMPMVFNKEELRNCSLLGQKKNTKMDDPRPGLEETKRNFLEDLIAKAYTVAIKEVRGKMRDRLKMFSRK